MDELKQELGDKLRKKQELNQNIPLKEQELRGLEDTAGKQKEELAGARSRQEELAGQIQALRNRLPFPDQDGTQQKITALQENFRHLPPHWNRPEKLQQTGSRNWPLLMLRSENRKIF